MAVAPMSRLELYGLRQDLPAIMDFLQRAAVVEIEATEDNACVFGELPPIAMVEREIGDLERLIAFFDRYAPRRPNLIEQFAGIKTILEEEEFRRYAEDVAALKDLAEKVRALDAELSGTSGRLHEQESLASQLQPWAALDLTRAELDGTKHVRVALGAIEEKSYEQLSAALREAEPRAVLARVAGDREGARVAIFWPREADLGQALSGLPFNQVNLPVFTGRPGQALDQLASESIRLQEQLAALTADTARLAEARPRVEARLDFLRGELAKLTAAQALAETRHTFAVSGWIPSRLVKYLRGDLEQAGFTFTLTTRAAEPGENAPVELRNKGLINPFEALVEGFSYPKYGEIDPTKVTAPFFFIFFGFCVSDVGYGLTLIAFCLSLLKWLKMGPVGRKLSRMFILGGVGAILMGFVTGSFFGDLFGMPGLINPIKKDALLLLGMALALGVIQLFLGTILSAVPSMREGRWRDAFFNQGMWLLFLTSGMLLIGKGPLGLGRFGKAVDYLALGSALGVVYSATRDKKGILGKLLGIPAGLFSIYGSIGYYSDILSYSRLMALGLSGGVMAVIINMFARMAAKGGILGIMLGVLIGVFGHAMNVALGILGAYVHSSRLQFLEFYGKFYEGGGRPFRPLRAERKYTFVVKQKEA